MGMGWILIGGLGRCPGFGPQQVLLLVEKKESGNTCLDRGLPAIGDKGCKNEDLKDYANFKLYVINR